MTKYSDSKLAVRNMVTVLAIGVCACAVPLTCFATEEIAKWRIEAGPSYRIGWLWPPFGVELRGQGLQNGTHARTLFSSKVMPLIVRVITHVGVEGLTGVLSRHECPSLYKLSNCGGADTSGSMFVSRTACIGIGSARESREHAAEGAGIRH